MISTHSLRFIAFYIIISSVLFALLALLGIQYQYYIWEFYIDLKIAGIAVMLLYLYKKGNFQFTLESLAVTRWEMKGLIFWFCFPIVLYAIIIGMGLLSEEVRYNSLENAPTLIMATLFDIPALFVFSAIFVLVEEVFFRSLLYNAFLKRTSQQRAFFFSALLWSIFVIPDFISLNQISLSIFPLLVIYSFFIGVFNAVLFNKYSSVLFPYAFRIGIITLTPILISSLVIETDSFFVTTSPFFSAEGLVFSSFLLIFSIFLFKRDTSIKKDVNVQNLAA